MYIIVRSWTDAPQTKSIKMNNHVKYLLMILTFISSSLKTYAYVSGDRLTIGDWTIVVTNGTNNYARVVATTLTGAVQIPETLFDGKDVTFTITEVGGEADGWTGVTAVTIPETVTTLVNYCCRGAQLEELYIPKSVVSIHTGEVLWTTQIKKFVVDPDNPVFMAYDDCLYRKTTSDGITNVPSLLSVPKNKELTDGVLNVMEGCKKLESYCCVGNSYIKTAKIPASVTEIWTNIGENANMEAFVVDEGNTAFASQDGVLFNKAMTELVKYPFRKSGTSYTVPETVETVESRGIYSLNLTTLNLNKVEKLESEAITNCPRLKEITIPQTLTSIEGGVSDCPAIEKYNVEEGHEFYYGDDGVVYTADKKTLLLYPAAREGDTYEIPSDYGVTTIGENAFYTAQKLNKLIIPNTVETLGKRAFYRSKISEFVFEEESNLKLIDDQCFTYCTITVISLPNSVETIGNNAFARTALNSITIPVNTKTIGTNAFDALITLKSVVVPDGSQLEKMSAMAFQECPNLETFTFEGSCTLETISNTCFKGDTKLQSFAVPASVTTIGANAFKDCANLKEVTFAEDAVINNINTAAFADCGIESLSLPESVKTIQNEAFRNCTALTEVNLGKGASTISPTSFLYCENLEAINVDRANGKYSSSDGILLTADKETLVIFPEGKANENFTLLPPSLKTIGEKAFYYSKKLTNVTIPNKVTAINSRAFGLCENLKTVTFLCDEMIDPANIAQALNAAAFDDGVTTTDDKRKNIDINVRKNLLEQYKGNEYYQTFGSITPSFIDNTEEYIAVSDNTVDLLDTQREDYTFLVPKTVTHEGKSYKVSLIGDYCFQKAKDAIKEVVVYESVEYIGAKAFMTNIDNNSSTVENIFFIEAQPTEDMLSTTRFLLDDTGKDYSEIAASTKVYVKKSALDTYKTAFDRYINGAYKYNATKPFRPGKPDMFDYRIPGITISSTYGTISREFDIDLGDVNENGEMKWWDDAKACPKVIAFTGAEDKSADNLTDTKWITMHSIFEGDDKKVDGLYVPAFTGVVLKAIDGNTPEDFYYRIGESDQYSYDGENVMKDVTVNKKTVSPTEDNGINFYISGGKLWKVASSKELPVHKSYMQLKEVSAGAKVMMRFSNGETTGIEVIMQQGSENGEVYDLQGRRVMDPQKGIYIKNGKKIVVR